MRLGRFALILAVPLLASCSGSSVDDVQHAVASDLNDTYKDIGVTVDNARCPAEVGEPEDGKSYVCTAEVDGHKIRMAAKAEGGEIKDYVSLDVVYDLGKLATELAESETAKAGHAVTVDCGTGLKVLPVGQKFDCTRTDGAERKTIEVVAKVGKKG